MRRTVLALSLGALLLSGCDSEHSALTPAAAQAPVPAAVEAHTGTVAVSGQEYPLDLEFTRRGTALTGLGRVVISDTRAVTGPLVGSDDGSRHQFTLDLRPTLPLLTFSGQGGADGGFVGTIDDDAGNASQVLGQTDLVLDDGQYRSGVTAAQPLAGKYTVTFDDGTVTQFEATQAPSNDPNLPSFDSTNAVLTYVVDQNVADPTDAGGGTNISGNLFIRLNTFDSNNVPYVFTFLSGSAQSGRYTQAILGLSSGFKRGSYTMRPGF